MNVRHFFLSGLFTAAFLSTIAFSPSPALAVPWYAPAHSGSHMVNAELLPQRLIGQPLVKAAWNGQLVLWEGRILQHYRHNGHDYLNLSTAAGPVVVRYKNKAKNLEYDRTGFRVAVKGSLTISNHRLELLEGQSLILLEPPLQYSLKLWDKNPQPSLASFLAWRIFFHNPERPWSEDRAIAGKLVKEAKKNQLDPLLFASLLQIESAWDVKALSVSGAQGLGQLMPKTAVGLGVKDALDPYENITGSSRMTANLLKKFAQTANPRAAALSGYNAGPTRVSQLKGQVPKIPETTNYVYFIGYVYHDMQKQAQRYSVVIP